MSLLGLVANIRIAGGPDRCIRICSQFLVASQSQIIISEFYFLMVASGGCTCFEGYLGAAKAARVSARPTGRDASLQNTYTHHEQVSIGMVGK